MEGLLNLVIVEQMAYRPFGYGWIYIQKPFLENEFVLEVCNSCFLLQSLIACISFFLSLHICVVIFVCARVVFSLTKKIKKIFKKIIKGNVTLVNHDQCTFQGE